MTRDIDLVIDGRTLRLTPCKSYSCIKCALYDRKNSCDCFATIVANKFGLKIRAYGYEFREVAKKGGAE